jgi:hypothetical protein
MVLVVVKTNTDFRQVDMDLRNSTLQGWYGSALTFCYYQEVSEEVVFAGMCPVADTSREQPALVFFVRLSENQPVDLGIDEMQAQLLRHSEYIPADI